MTTKIQWTNETWNPVTGCDRTSPGCDHCYALTLAGRLKAMGQAKYQNDGDPRTSGPGFGVTCHPGELDRPLSWRKPRIVFVNSMSDLFHKRVPDPFVAEVFAVMAVARRHTFQVLTKRPQRMARIFESGYVQRGATGYRDHVVSPSGRQGLGSPADYRTWQEAVASLAHRWAIDRTNAGELSDRLMYDLTIPNVWLGTSIESDLYTFRADHLRATPAAVRFLSCEPLLGPLPSLDLGGIDWCIVGGESGPGARPMDLAWARDLVDRCRAAGVACFVKQLGSRWGRSHHDIGTWPEDLQVREIPR